MTARLALAALLSASSPWIIACERGAAPPGRMAPAAEQAAGDDHPEEANAIHLGEDMIRDLRISTASVTERSGVQEVSVLGQLAAAQDRYAEVAPRPAGRC